VTDADYKLHSEEMENAFLGCVIMGVRPEDIEEVDESFFLLPRSKEIWRSVVGVISKGHSPDYVTVSNELYENGKLDFVGGNSFLTSLLTDRYSVLYIDQYSTVLKEKRFRRQILDKAKRLAKIALDESNDPMALYEDIDREEISLEHSGNGAVHWKEYLSQVYDQVAERANDPKDVWGIPTYFKDIDFVTGGGQPGEFWLISGPPGNGKSILGDQMSLQSAGGGVIGRFEYGKQKPFVIYSFEMLGMQVARRLQSGVQKIATRKLKTGDLSQDEWFDFISTIEKNQRVPLYICEEGSITLSELRADLKRLKKNNGIVGALIDYVYLMTPSIGGNRPPYEKAEIISTTLKQIAQELGIWIIGIESMTKTGMDKETPEQQDMKGGGEQIHAADVIMFVNKVTRKEARNDSQLGILTDAELANVRKITFGKGRELENDAVTVYLVKQEKWPVFGDYYRG